MSDQLPDLDVLLPPIQPEMRELAPSALGQFIRLEQCQRFLRLDLYRDSLKVQRTNAFAELDVELEQVAPLASKVGKSWEQDVQNALRSAGWEVYEASKDKGTRERKWPLGYWIDLIEPGQVWFVHEPMLQGKVAGWSFNQARPDLVLLARGVDESLSAKILDVKSAREVSLDHRIQVAIYARLVGELFPDVTITEGVIYRPPLEPMDVWPLTALTDRATAHDLLRIGDGMLLSINQEPDLIHGLLDRTLFDPESLANRVSQRPFSELPFHLSGKCDGCPNNQLCLSTARQSDDLSLIPYLTERLKSQLNSAGIATVGDLIVAHINQPVWSNLLAMPGLGAHLPEIRSRAAAYEAWSNNERIDPWLNESDFTTLPFVSTGHNANLIQIYVDIQTEPESGHVASLGALINCFRDGTDATARAVEVVSVPEQSLESHADEAGFVQEWLKSILIAIQANMSRDADGIQRAPVHLYLWDSTQKANLAALANRQHQSVLGIDALFKLLTDRAAFDSPSFSIIADGIEHQRALPMLCQSLQSVSRWLGYEWPGDIIDTFRTRQFDSLRLETSEEYAHLVPARSRFRSDIPGEYFQVAWQQTGDEPGTDDAIGWRFYGKATVSLLVAYVTHRLKAMQHVTGTLRTDRREVRTPFDLSVLNRLAIRPSTPIESVREFIAIERHIDFDEWRRGRSRPPDRRVLAGESLLVRFHDDQQDIEARVRIREARDRFDHNAELTVEQRGHLSESEKKNLAWTLNGVTISLRIDASDQPIACDQVLRNTRLRPGDHVVVGPAFATYPTDEGRTTRPSSARTLLYQFRGVITAISADGTIALELRETHGKRGGFTFSSFLKSPPRDGALLAIEPNPDSFPEQRQWTVAEAIAEGMPNGGYALLWPGRRTPGDERSVNIGQHRFAEGLRRFPGLDPSASRFEEAKLTFIGQDANAPVTLVQGPPGTGKSTTTGFAVLARLQAAISADRPLRIAVACKTHAATDVLLNAIRRAQRRLQEIEAQAPDFFTDWFDSRILAVPLYRFDHRTQGSLGPDIRSFESSGINAQLNEAIRWPHVVVAGTTNGLGRLANRAWTDGNPPWDLLVLDEASQMSVPEYLTAACGLKLDGSLIVVGDPRQMPPIVRGDWEEGDATSVDPHAAYRSLFDTIKQVVPDKDRVDIAFSESFRIHRRVATYLRDQIYVQDGIHLHSQREDVLTAQGDDSLVDAVLKSPAPVVLIVHDEQQSQQRNKLERNLVSRLVFALASLDERPSIGVVVPHRAQRAELHEQIYNVTGSLAIAESVDTIERFQGAERDVIIVSATESDPAYLRDTASFLLDPRRLTVALSRAEHKLVVIASHSIFDYVPTDETLLRDSELWRSLRNRFCTRLLWQGAFEGHYLRVTASKERSDFYD